MQVTHRALKECISNNLKTSKEFIIIHFIIICHHHALITIILIERCKILFSFFQWNSFLEKEEDKEQLEAVSSQARAKKFDMIEWCKRNKRNAKRESYQKKNSKEKFREKYECHWTSITEPMEKYLVISR